MLTAARPLGHRAAHYGPAIAVALIELLGWLRIVSSDWVRAPAEAYADRLMEAVDVLKREVEDDTGTASAE